LLIASDAFPEERQGLAGALFNVFYFLGSSVGMAVVNVILAAAPSSSEHSHGSEGQMAGFRDSFWTLFGMAVVSATVGAVGLRKLGRIGERKG
jgi:MFS family permease